ESKAILFSGNNYSLEWRKEAATRGLPILDSSAEALSVFADKKATKFLVDSKALNAEEIEARYHIYVERYVTTLEIENTALAELIREFVIPAVEKQLERSYAIGRDIATPVLK